ncbi:hypothetical protein TNCV_2369871 [Trichonephila clavipes]|nr:hypothetical protein TNCV_2369871 [Trichonephila clavipes]
MRKDVRLAFESFQLMNFKSGKEALQFHASLPVITKIGEVEEIENELRFQKPKWKENDSRNERLQRAVL